jgi:hypothetical protein
VAQEALTIHTTTWKVQGSDPGLHTHRPTCGFRHFPYKLQVAVSIPTEVSEYFKYPEPVQLPYNPGVHQASNKNEYQKDVLVVKDHKTNFNAICEPTV